jgi:murein L,D-transpeptidase YcbB/YkuD
MLGKALLFSLLATTATTATRAEPGDSLSLYLNLPSYTLEVWEGAERIRTFPVTIGQRAYQTPTGAFQITRIEWNPSWVPPESPWARGKEEEPPGRNNPMGRVKMQFDDYLYVHGSAKTKEVGGPHSHGCVRLKNADALELARLIALHEELLSSGEITALEKNSRRTRSVRLARPIPLRIRYDLTAEVDGQLIDYKDPYKWAEAEGSAPR